MRKYLLPLLVTGLVFVGTDYLFSQQSGGPGIATSVSSTAFPLLAPNGSAAAPSYSFSSSAGDGLSLSSTGVLVLGSSFARLQLGGTTASFPAIKRNAAAINFRLADDSGDANVTMGSATFSGLLNIGTNAIGANGGGTVAAIMLGRLVSNQIELQADNNRFNLTNTAGSTGAMIDTSTDGTLKVLTRAAANTAFVQASAFQGATANLVRLGGATGIEFNTNGVTLGTCGTGAVTTGARGSAGEVTATGATTCSVNFTTSFTNTPFCTMDDETTVGGRISATAAGSITFAGLTAGDKVSWTCTGWF